MREKDSNKIEKKNNTCINVFGYENKLPFPIYISDQKCENSMDLLPVINENKSIMCTSKILTDFCFTKQRIKTKNIFARVVYSVVVIKMRWQSIRKFVWALMVHNLQD